MSDIDQKLNDLIDIVKKEKKVNIKKKNSFMICK